MWGLDLLFVAVFGWGVLGAAIATVIAQGFSAAYCLSVLRHIPDVRLTREDFYQQPAMSLRLLKLAAPLAIQNVIISVGGLTVQYVVNGFGFLFVAGFTAANKLYGVLEMASVSYGYAITTYVGQNLGTKKCRRIRNGVRSGVYMALFHIYCDIRCDGDYRKKYPVTVCIRRSGAGKTGIDIAQALFIRQYFCGFYIFCMSIVQPFRDWAIH